MVSDVNINMPLFIYEYVYKTDPPLSYHFTTLIENNSYLPLWKPPISLAICSKRGSDTTRNYFKIIEPQQFIS